MAKYFLQPRLCPEINLSNNDLKYSIGKYGSKETIDAIHSIVMENYDFPLGKYVGETEIPKEVARLNPSCPEMKACRSPVSPLIKTPLDSNISSLRVSRKSATDPPYPGITISLTDRYAKDDYVLSELFETQILRGWYGTSKLHTVNPHDRYKNRELYDRIILSLLEDPNSSSLTGKTLRKGILSSSEITNPHVELYTYILEKLEPKKINVFETGFGSVIMALLRYSTIKKFRCHYYSSLDISESLKILIKTFQREGTTFTVQNARMRKEDFDLTIGEIFPFETYHLHNLRETPDDYHDYMYKNILTIVKEQTEELKEGARLVIVIPLRESKKHPTVEPLILYILGYLPNLTFAGNLISHNKDFIALLLISKNRPSNEVEEWSRLFSRLYPELLPREEVIEEVKEEQKAEIIKPREVIMFPSRFRICPYSTSGLNCENIHFSTTQNTMTKKENVLEECSEPCGFDSDPPPLPPIMTYSSEPQDTRLVVDLPLSQERESIPLSTEEKDDISSEEDSEQPISGNRESLLMNVLRPFEFKNLNDSDDSASST